MPNPIAANLERDAKIIRTLIQARHLLHLRSGKADYTLEVRLINEALELLGVDPTEALPVDFGPGE